MVSHGCINFKHRVCDHNKCAGHDESLGHHPSCPYLDDENNRDYEDYDDIKEEEMQSDKETLSTIPEEISDGYELDPHSHIIEQDQLNGYHHISPPADDSSSVTNNDNIPANITDVINDACEYHKQYRKQHNTDCYDYYYPLQGSSHQNGNRYFPTTRSSDCGTYRHRCLDCTLAEAVYQKEKEIQLSQRDT